VLRAPGWANSSRINRSGDVSDTSPLSRKHRITLSWVFNCETANVYEMVNFFTVPALAGSIFV
jgi:hypothetical protein